MAVGALERHWRSIRRRRRRPLSGRGEETAYVVYQISGSISAQPINRTWRHWRLVCFYCYLLLEVETSSEPPADQRVQ